MVSAPDVITYIGVPLAVLGVLPILYTCIRVLLTAHKLKRELRENHIAHEAVIRSSTISGIIEIELPRRQIAPLDRHDDRYWALSSTPSALKGGSWSIFNWDSLVTGHGLYRIQYTEELRQPQAEIDFEDLIAFLLDRGAVPSADGFRMLRTSGLWTPTGTTLLLSPDTTQPVLKTVVPDDSDGILALAVQWRSEWDYRSVDSLPPYWMRLEGWEWKRWCNGCDADERNKDGDMQQQHDIMNSRIPDPAAIRIRIGPNGVICAETERTLSPPDPSNHSHNNISWPSTRDAPTNPHLSLYLPIFHLQAFPSSSPLPCANIPTVAWFCSAATALGTHKSMHLWSYTIPPAILAFAAKDSVPCGVMVLLGLMHEDDTPKWSTPLEDPELEAQRKHTKFQEWSRRLAAEARLPAAHRADAAKKRMQDDHWAFVTEMNEKAARRREWERKRVGEALVSPRLSMSRVAREGMKWLWMNPVDKEGQVAESDVSRAHEEQNNDTEMETEEHEEQRKDANIKNEDKTSIPPKGNQYQNHPTVQATVESLLYAMILNVPLSTAITELLNIWIHWADSGGMNTSQWEYLLCAGDEAKAVYRKRVFVLSSCLLALIADAGTSAGSAMSGWDANMSANVGASPDGWIFADVAPVKSPSGWSTNEYGFEGREFGGEAAKSGGMETFGADGRKGQSVNVNGGQSLGGRTMTGIASSRTLSGLTGGGGSGWTGAATGTGVRGTNSVSEDMREVIKIWRKVRLG